MAGRIFLSYRRSDSGGYAGRLHDHLALAFKDADVFRDVDSLRPGQKWTQRLDEVLASSKLMLVVIGPDWLTTANEHGRRLDDPEDHVRLEVQAALTRGVPVIPALVGGATMPRPEALPEPLRPLCDWQSVRLSDESWRTDFEELEEAVRSALEGAPDDPSPSTVRSRRLPLIVAAAAAVVAAVAILAVVLAGGNGGGSAPPAIAVGGGPDAVAIGGGSVWVVNYDSGTVTRINQATGAVTAGAIAVGNDPDGIAVGAGYVWVANYSDNTVSRIALASGQVVGAPIAVGGGPYGIAVADGSVWVADYGPTGHGDTVTRIDARTAKVVGAPITVGTQPTVIAYDPGALLWVADRGSNAVTAINPINGRVVVPAIAVGASPRGVAVGAGTVWVANHDANTVTRLKTSTGASEGPPIAVGRGPWDVAVGRGSVWVTNNADDTVTRIDELTGAVLATIRVGRAPIAVAVSADSTWVVNNDDGTVTRLR